ncbi:metal-sensitive transcriptional regulator [Actinomyces slackii]|uniref:Copper-sensitive operon repressor n=1 Tax=Actinomyces slackii TaxID=52774 RepID=A0A3S4SRN2_9ACTO|nr:metal-sensitive transcriptional regulator [Actinomyces slackii]VEG73397.1 Copper-sensitive operon repressor [Actinomyces slackii]
MGTALDPADLRPTLARLKRARGQLDGVIRMLEEGRDCEETVVQIAAVSKAVNRAGLAVIASGMRTCLSEDPTGQTMDTRRLERLLMSLA